jgi:hypothetical protein
MLKLLVVFMYELHVDVKHHGQLIRDLISQLIVLSHISISRCTRLVHTVSTVSL